MTRAHLLRTTAITSGSVAIPESAHRLICQPPAVTIRRPDGCLLDLIDGFGFDGFSFRSPQPGEYQVRLIDQTGKGLDAHA